MKDVKRYVGSQIRRFRLMRKMTQVQLGTKIGVKHNTISAYESGTNEPEQNILFSLSEALGVSIDDFFPKQESEFQAAESKAEYKVNTIAAHFEGEDYTDEEMKEIIEYAQYLKSKRK